MSDGSLRPEVADDDEPVLRDESADFASGMRRSEKVCRLCKTDLAGKKRYRDAAGYLCARCEKIDRKRRVPCAECGKPTLPENLRPWGPISICPGCFTDHDADPKKRRVKQVSLRKHDEFDVQRAVITGVIVVAFLLIIGLLPLACG
jgi:hypothetical protein